ncbi:MAG: hypothetical protein OXG82_19400 [Gammaproteobacteria bacterium]|nr:hypothetical protein [Gammaproteobacteria bacterium]
MTDTYTDRQLESLLADLQSDLAEREESLNADSPQRLRKAVCAFANDLPDHQQAGVVFVGATDAGAPSGLITSRALTSSSCVSRGLNGVAMYWTRPAAKARSRISYARSTTSW